MEQERSEQDSSFGDALALALRCARFCLASLILSALYSLAPFLTRPHPFARIYAFCSQMLNVEIIEGGFEGVFVSLLLTTMRTFAHF